MPGHPQAVEASHNGDLKTLLTTLPPDQVSMHNDHHNGPFLRAVLLMTVEVLWQSSLRSTPWQCKWLKLLLCFFEKHKGLPPPLAPPLPPSAMTKLKQPTVWIAY